MSETFEFRWKYLAPEVIGEGDHILNGNGLSGNFNMVRRENTTDQVS